MQHFARNNSTTLPACNGVMSGKCPASIITAETSIITAEMRTVRRSSPRDRNFAHAAALHVRHAGAAEQG
jgi:hypothetical protein